MKTGVGENMDKDISILEQRGIENDGLISAKDVIDKNKLPKHIKTALLFFDSRPSKEIKENSKIFFNFIAASSVLPQYIYKNQIVISYAPLGGPAAGGLVEELIAYGVKRIIACGSSGLIGDFDSSKFLLVSKAIRDEGLSYHYLKPTLFVHTDQELNHQIKEYFSAKNIDYDLGITWTTDAFYKETKERINIRKEQGAIAVEMECASMAAVCLFRKVEFAQVLFFSDIVNQETWSGFRTDRHTVKEIINKVMIDIAMNL
jgi:uridine phosphorylase